MTETPEKQALLDDDPSEVTDTPTPGSDAEKWANIGASASKYGSPRRAIRQHCLSCVADSAKEVELCQCPDCKLWPFRFGAKPETAERRGRLVDPEKFVDIYTPPVLKRQKAGTS